MNRQPGSPQHGISVARYYIIHGIKFKQFYQNRIAVQHIQVPHDRCHPDPHLKDNTDNLCQVSEKNDHCAGNINQRQGKNKSTK